MLTLVQLTDCHLSASDDPMFGFSQDASLESVVELVQGHHKDIDALLLTGDLTQDGHTSAYQKVDRITANLSEQRYWLPGNHDDSTNMRSIGASQQRLLPVVRFEHWQIIMLDSHVPGEVHGYLGLQSLHALAQALDERPDLNAMVCLHHHPVDINSAWIDEIGLHNADELFAVLNARPQVKALVWGHIHQEYDGMLNNIRLLACPSTCFQFLPNSEDFSIDTQSQAGYRWFELHDDGNINTGVRRLPANSILIDSDGDGYE